MSLPAEIMAMYEDLYEECLVTAKKNMLPFGYSPAEIKAACLLYTSPSPRDS